MILQQFYNKDIEYLLGDGSFWVIEIPSGEDAWIDRVFEITPTRDF